MSELQGLLEELESICQPQEELVLDKLAKCKELAEALENPTPLGQTELALLSAEDIRKQERKRVWDEINKQIKTGYLQGNGCDETATRNGLVKATNIIFNLGI